MRILDYIYYRFYLLNKKTSMSDIAEYGAVINMAVVLGFNFIVICGNLEINLLAIAPSRVLSWFLGGGMMVILYFVYVKNKRYLQIIEKYRDESKRDKLKGNIIIIAYVVVSLACLLVF